MDKRYPRQREVFTDSLGIIRRSAQAGLLRFSLPSDHLSRRQGVALPAGHALPELDPTKPAKMVPF